MTTTGTTTAAFTVTEARYIGAKIGTDLRLLSSLYGKPNAANIDDYVEEAALLLRDGYLETVSYGFRDPSTNEWTLRLRYTATAGGQLTDGRPGSLPTTAAIGASSFYTYLTYSQKFIELTPEKRGEIQSTLPVRRVSGEEPGTGSGSMTSGTGYARNGVGVARDTFTSN